MADNTVTIVYFVTASWESFFSIRLPLWQNFARTLGSQARVICVGRGVDPLLTPIVNRRRFGQWLSGGMKLRQLVDGVYAFSPVVALHEQAAFYVPLAGAINRQILAHQIRRVVASLGGSRDQIVAWFSHPLQHRYIGALGEDLAIFHATDDFTVLPGTSERLRSLVRDAERTMLRRVDLVFATSPNLVQRAAHLNGGAILFPGAADTRHFRRALEPETDVPEDLRPIRRPVIGFAGSLFGIVDMGLLQYLAKTRPDWSLVLLGPIVEGSIDVEGFRRLTSLENVHYLGRKDYNLLPNYYKGFDVCLLPYKRMDYSESVFPNKLFQYLAAGKPVVSVGLPSMEEYRNLAKVADGYEGFVRGVEEALLDGDPEAPRRRSQTAEANSWEARVTEMWKVIKGKLDGKRPDGA
ncbi:MAG: glycosyltransferase [Chloroflexi bacterium]|nr:glycosyltransferase [Chloroflexota bacterium]